MCSFIECTRREHVPKIMLQNCVLLCWNSMQLINFVLYRNTAQKYVGHDSCSDATFMLASYFLRHQNKCPKIHLEINIYTVNVMQTIKTICYFSMRLLSRFGFLYPPPFLISLSCAYGCLLFEFELLSGALFCSLYCLFAQSETGVSMCRNDVNDVC